ncbi:eukaryotic translation initiation factor 4E [Tuber magnatum]|uniref:Eukaryotic translation initiation factor 4E n=1 Tax=Tuber magnatum TaxID=42249 RepID=A0A317SRA4_9PEZI|nr:eukaryotic translation initiation factor 4E [Tuber magnatum]
MPETKASSSAIPDEQRPLDQIPISPPNGEVEEETGEGGLGLPGNKQQLTVFHSPDNFNVKHPLMNKWTLWYTKPPSNKGENNWNDLLKEVVTFDSVEEFWGIYNNIAKTSELSLKSDYHLFKTGVRPEWEDPQNKHGGKWAYQFKDKRGVPIDELWLNVILAAIGETLESDKDKEIMGAVVNVRKAFFRIGLWTKTTGGAKGTPKEVALMEIGKRFKEVLRLGDKDLVEFSGHTESAHSGQSRAKAKYVA